MNDLDAFTARTQARLAYGALLALFTLACGLLGALIYNIKADPQWMTLIVTLATGMLTLTGTAFGYFFARHRPPTIPDEDDKSLTPLPQPPEKT